MSPRKVGLQRPRTVGRQQQHGWRAFQLLLPVSKLLVQYFALQPVPLPHRVVCVLDRQLRQSAGLAQQRRFIQMPSIRAAGSPVDQPSLAM